MVGILGLHELLTTGLDHCILRISKSSKTSEWTKIYNKIISVKKMFKFCIVVTWHDVVSFYDHAPLACTLSKQLEPAQK